MPGKYESEWNVGMLTDEEVSAAIRYLDPGSSSETNGEDNATGIAICISLILLIAYVAFIYLYHRVP